MAAVPALWAVTLPVLSTVATVGAPLVHVTFLLVASSGCTVAVSWAVPPTSRAKLVLSSDTSVTLWFMGVPVIPFPVTFP